MRQDHVVLVHGFLSGGAYWHKQLPELQKFFNVTAIDLPGFAGRSDEACAGRIELMAEDVFAQLDKLGVARFHLIGHSMGGMIVQTMVKQRPQSIDKLILYGTGADGSLPGRFESLQKSIQTHSKETFTQHKSKAVHSWFSTYRATTTEQDKDIKDAMLLANSVSFDNYLLGLMAMNQWNGQNYLPEIQQKTLVIWGDQDKSYPWEQPAFLWDRIPNSRLAVIPDAAHNAHLDEPVIFNQLLCRFLSGE